jgi:hypothetical protein
MRISRNGTPVPLIARSVSPGGTKRAPAGPDLEVALAGQVGVDARPLDDALTYGRSAMDADASPAPGSSQTTCSFSNKRRVATSPSGRT